MFDQSLVQQPFHKPGVVLRGYLLLRKVMHIGGTRHVSEAMQWGFWSCYHNKAPSLTLQNLPLVLLIGLLFRHLSTYTGESWVLLNFILMLIVFCCCCMQHLFCAAFLILLGLFGSRGSQKKWKGMESYCMSEVSATWVDSVLLCCGQTPIPQSC